MSKIENLFDTYSAQNTAAQSPYSLQMSQMAQNAGMNISAQNALMGTGSTTLIPNIYSGGGQTHLRQHPGTHMQVPNMMHLKSNAAFDLPLSELCTLWEARFGHDWVKESDLQYDSDGFVHTMQQRLSFHNKLERVYVASESTFVLRIAR